MRPSNTQPVIVCRFEANTAERMDEIKNDVWRCDFAEIREKI